MKTSSDIHFSVWKKDTKFDIAPSTQLDHNASVLLWSLLLTWINFNTGMDK